MLNYQAIVTLYIPLYLLYKSEGTLDISVYQNELNVQIFTNKKSSKNNAKRNDEKTDFNDIFEQSTKQKTMNTPKTIELVANASESGQSADQDTIMINESLFTFLYHNQVNHKVFSEYLRFCFAIENLLFVERVSVLYQIVLGMKQKSDVMLSEISGSDIDAESPRSRASPTNLPSCSEFEFCVEDAAMHRLEFRYLTSIYERYQRIIDDAVKADDERCDIEKYKKALFDICQEIYDEFISCFAETQLNLGSDVQERLELILGGVRGDGMVQFKSYDDFMTLFDGALIETYGLMISAYLFQFKKYVRTRFSHVQFE